MWLYWCSGTQKESASGVFRISRTRHLSQVLLTPHISFGRGRMIQAGKMAPMMQAGEVGPALPAQVGPLTSNRLFNIDQ